jgi:hypothetical protein
MFVDRFQRVEEEACGGNCSSAAEQKMAVHWPVAAPWVWEVVSLATLVPPLVYSSLCHWTPMGPLGNTWDPLLFWSFTGYLSDQVGQRVDQNTRLFDQRVMNSRVNRLLEASLTE